MIFFRFIEMKNDGHWLILVIMNNFKINYKITIEQCVMYANEWYLKKHTTYVYYLTSNTYL